MARDSLFIWQYSGLVDAVLWASINPTYTAINVIEAIIGAVLLRKLLPWYNPLQNLNDWIRGNRQRAGAAAGGRYSDDASDPRP